MSRSEGFDKFTINTSRDRFAEATNNRGPSEDEARRGEVKRGIDEYHEEREFKRMIASSYEVGG